MKPRFKTSFPHEGARNCEVGKRFLCRAPSSAAMAIFAATRSRPGEAQWPLDIVGGWGGCTGGGAIDTPPYSCRLSRPVMRWGLSPWQSPFGRTSAMKGIAGSAPLASETGQLSGGHGFVEMSRVPQQTRLWPLCGVVPGIPWPYFTPVILLASTPVRSST